MKVASLFVYELLVDTRTFFHDEGPYHIEATPLICSAKELILSEI